MSFTIDYSLFNSSFPNTAVDNLKTIFESVWSNEFANSVAPMLFAESGMTPPGWTADFIFNSNPDGYKRIWTLGTLEITRLEATSGADAGWTVFEGSIDSGTNFARIGKSRVITTTVGGQLTQEVEWGA